MVSGPMSYPGSSFSFIVQAGAVPRKQEAEDKGPAFRELTSTGRGRLQVSTWVYFLPDLWKNRRVRGLEVTRGAWVWLGCMTLLGGPAGRGVGRA